MSSNEHDQSASTDSITSGPSGNKKLRARSSVGTNRNKRNELRKLVKQTAKCEHLSIYSQITFICRRLALLHENNKITPDQALNLILSAHENLSHKGMTRSIVAEVLHRDLDKLESSNRTHFGLVMANTNSSIHTAIKKASEQDSSDDDNGQERYFVSYWADVI